MIRVDPRSNSPIYEQIIDGFKENILRGYIKPGDVIPSVRRLALEIGINPNTVSRAYQELERQGIIETLRGRGTYVAENLRLEATDGKLKKLRTELKKLVIEMRYAGLDREQMRQILDEVYDRLEEGEDIEN